MKMTNNRLNNKLIVDISDMLVSATYQGKKLYAEAGIALLPKNSTAVIGKQAQLSFKQHPTRIQSQYWSNLNTELLGLGDSNIRHNADLVWHQLSQIRQFIEQETEVGTAIESYIFLTPANFNSQQMQLLAGICQSLEINIDFFANKGLTELITNNLNSGSSDSELFVHADSQLHQLVLSRYRVNGDAIELVDHENHRDLGIARLIDHLLHLLSEKFIQHSRFDPLHSGDTEQQLFDQLVPFLIYAHRNPVQIFTIETSQKNHQIELGQKEQQELNTVIANYLAEISQRSEQLVSPQLNNSVTKIFSSLLTEISGFEGNTVQLENSEIGLSQPFTVEVIKALSTEKGTEMETESIAYISSYSRFRSTLSKPDAHNNLELPPLEKADALVVNNRVFTEETGDLLSELGFTSDLVSWDNHSLIAISEQLSINAMQAKAGQAIQIGDQLGSPNSNVTALAVDLAVSQ